MARLETVRVNTLDTSEQNLLESDAYADLYWTRPADWLVISGVQAGDEKIQGLLWLTSGITVSGTQSMNVLEITAHASADVDVDWGDGSTVSGITAGSSVAHQYDFDSVPAGTETDTGHRQVIVTITPQVGENFTTGIPQFTQYTADQFHSKLKEIHMAAPNATAIDWDPSYGPMKMELESVIWFGESILTILNGFFEYCYALENVQGFDTSQVTSFAATFRNCSNLKILNIDFSSATSMSSAFTGCAELVSIGKHDFPEVTTFQGAFINSGAFSVWPMQTAFSAPKCTNFYYAFENTGLIEIPDHTFLTNVNVRRMFQYCDSLIRIGNLTFKGNVTAGQDMCGSCLSLRSVGRIKYEGASNSNTTGTFFNCQSLANIGEIDCTNLNTLYYYLGNCFQLTRSPLKNTGNIGSWYGCFQDTCINLADIFETHDFSSANNVAFSFRNNRGNTTDLSHLDLSFPLVTNAANMLSGCRGLKFGPKSLSLPICTDAGSLFGSSGNLLTCGDLDLPSATTVSSAFYNCPVLNNVGNINIPSASSVGNLFRDCAGLRRIESITAGSISTSFNSSRFIFYGAGLQFLPYLDTSAPQRLNEWLLGPVIEIPEWDVSGTVDGYGLSLSNQSTLIRCRAINIKSTTNFYNNSLTRDAILEIFHNLVDRSALAAQNINVSGNSGASELTAGDLSIATSKNWTVTT